LSHGSSQRVVDAFPYNTQVQVHYSPANPNDALLQPGLRLGVFQGLLVATLVLSLALVIGACCLSTKNALVSGNTVSFAKDSVAGKVNGPILLSMLVQGLLLWWVT
jgi:hypothetical protein